MSKLQWAVLIVLAFLVASISGCATSSKQEPILIKPACPAVISAEVRPEPIAPSEAIVNDTARDGSPFGGWIPAQRISLEAALRHYTADAAYAAFREQEIGVLRTGMLADFVVLSEEILDVPPVALRRAKPVLTVMGGRDTYRTLPPARDTTRAP